jgi:hypothetical protein
LAAEQTKLFVGADEEIDAVLDQHSTVTVTVAQWVTIFTKRCWAYSRSI